MLSSNKLYKNTKNGLGIPWNQPYCSNSAGHTTPPQASIIFSMINNLLLIRSATTLVPLLEDLIIINLAICSIKISQWMPRLGIMLQLGLLMTRPLMTDIKNEQ